MVGKQLQPWRWIAVDDFASMVLKAFKDNRQAFRETRTGQCSQNVFIF
jgi:hypothetical protein